MELLVGEYDKKDDVKNVHYTKGGPYFYILKIIEIVDIE